MARPAPASARSHARLPARCWPRARPSHSTRACARLALGDARRAHQLATGDGPKLRAAAERFARGALEGEMEQRPWLELLSQARGRGAAVAAELDERFAEQLELLARRDRRRA